MAVIDVHGIGKRYPGRGNRPVLENVPLSIEKGAVLGLLGPNGAGKTTLIKILAGLLAPDSGAGTVLGYDLVREPARIRAKVSLVAPTVDVGIDNSLTVRQNLQFWAPVYGLKGSEARQRIADLLERLGLTAKAGAWPMHLSAGERQRLALARSLLAETPLVFLDEPTAKLDREGVRSVRAFIQDLNRSRGTTVVLTTHVMEEAEELCTEIALLREGRIRAHLPTAELLASLGLALPIRIRLSFDSADSGAHSDIREHLAGLVSAAPAVEHLVWQAASEKNEPRSGMFLLTVWSKNPARTTPVLLQALWASGVSVHAIETDRVTLDHVFRRLAANTLPPAEDSGPSHQEAPPETSNVGSSPNPTGPKTKGSRSG